VRRARRERGRSDDAPVCEEMAAGDGPLHLSASWLFTTSLAPSSGAARYLASRPGPRAGARAFKHTRAGGSQALSPHQGRRGATASHFGIPVPYRNVGEIPPLPMWERSTRTARRERGRAKPCHSCLREASNEQLTLPPNRNLAIRRSTRAHNPPPQSGSRHPRTKRAGCSPCGSEPSTHWRPD
jgi:hypothetical protein